MSQFKKLGGKTGKLKCECGKKRYPNSGLCPDCWGQTHYGGTRDGRGTVIQARLPRELWQATNFAASMIRKGEYRPKAIRIASNYYEVDYDDVQSALSQRAGRMNRAR